MIGEQLNEMRKKKDNRKNQFLKLAEQIKKILIEIRSKDNPTEVVIDDADLSINKLEELNNQLQLLEIEKVRSHLIQITSFHKINKLYEFFTSYFTPFFIVIG